MKIYILITSFFFLFFCALIRQSTNPYLTVEEGNHYNVVIYNNGLEKDTVLMSISELGIMAEYLHNNNVVFVLKYAETVYYKHVRKNDMNKWIQLEDLAIGSLAYSYRFGYSKAFYLEYFIKDIGELYSVDKRTGKREKIDLQIFRDRKIRNRGF